MSPLNSNPRELVVTRYPLKVLKNNLLQHTVDIIPALPPYAISPRREVCTLVADHADGRPVTIEPQTA